jgi:serine/threonine protein kinase
LWPFMECDYTSRSASTTSTNDIIKLQVLTTNGDLHVANHNVDREFPGTKSVDNIFPDVATYSSSDIQRVSELEMHIFKVKLNDSIYCLKTVDRTGHDSDFVREVSALRQCSHPNIIRLVGLVEPADQKGKIQGMLIDFVENARCLRDIEFISSDECDKWAGQMRDAIEYLHEKELVWGDAKPANVLINGNGNALLIDFGGGSTKGWVDLENYETYCGDLQGLERIVSSMKKKNVLLD